MIGIIGVGLVGSALAERFRDAGHEVLGFDTDPEKSSAESARSVFDSCNEIFLSLPTSDTVSTVLHECSPRPGTLIVDTSTGAPARMAEFGERLAATGIEYVDATIGGSSELVRRRESLVMCGGTAIGFERARPLLDHFAKDVFHLGSWGAGSKMKLVFNLVLGLHRAVLAEGLVFASATGVDPAAALEILKAGATYSRVMDIKGARMLNADYAPQARLSQHLKDVRLIIEEAAGRGLPLPLSAEHRRLLERAEDLGFGASDNCAVIEALGGLRSN